ncbi:TolB family protein, partial [Streptomyces mirabilis]|uniref:TolB family protein n=1 Tax=Streptomyces mirabilis TaxID=68239 RepID=UPI00367915C5
DPRPRLTFPHDQTNEQTSQQSHDQQLLLEPVSANGRYIAFVSAAANLVRGDTNGVADVFVHDLRTGRTQRIAQGPATGVALSGDGRNVVFATTAVLTEDDDNSLDDIYLYDIYLYDLRTHRTERISHGHADAPPRSRLNYSPAISANGRIVAYTTATPDAAPGDTNGRDDVIVHDWRTGKNELVEAADQLDPNHDWTHARNVYIRDRLKGTTEQISRPTRFAYKESSFDSSISANGRMFAFSSNVASLVPDDTNKVTDVFAFDRKTHTTVRVSTAADGTQADGVSSTASLSGDGRRVAFVSAATNFVPGDTNGLADVFVKDLRTGAVERVSVAADGTEADRPAVGSTSLSDHRIAFSSAATNLVRSDTNDTVDVFVMRHIAGSAPGATTTTP